MQHAQCKCIAWIRANKLEVNKTTEVSEYWNIRNEPKAISNPDIIISMHYVMILFGIEKILLTRRSMWIFSLPVRFFLNSIFDGSDSIWKKYTSMTLSGYRLNWWKRYFLWTSKLFCTQRIIYSIASNYSEWTHAILSILLLWINITNLDDVGFYLILGIPFD